MSTPAPPPGYQYETNTGSPVAPQSQLPSGYAWEGSNSPVDTQNVTTQNPSDFQVPPEMEQMVNRGEAIKQAIKEHNIKDFLGNAGAGTYEMISPEVKGLGEMAGGEGALTVGRALMKGSIRPALGLAGGAAAYGLTNEALERAGIQNWFIRHAVAIPAAIATGNAISPEAMEGVSSASGLAKKIFGFKTPPKVVAPPPLGPWKVLPEAAEATIPAGARNMKTLDDISKAQANKSFKSLSEKDKQAVTDLYDKLRLGEKQP